METIPLEMDDIFGDENGDEEDNYPRPLPDLPEELEPTQNTDLNVDAESAAVLSKLKDMKGAAKKTVRRPIPKLDAKRLTGDRGIPILPKLFENIKFKGKGHEMQDLKLIMDKLEHWGHRLFPKLPFDEVLERVEKLGSKKEVQTCIKKMRQDMPILDEDFVGDKNEEEINENKDNANDKQVDDLDAEEAFDEMMRQEASQRPQPTPDKPQSPPKSQSANVLSEDQKERIERNKRLAMEKRLAKLGQKPTGSPSSKAPVTPVVDNSHNAQTSTPSTSAPEDVSELGAQNDSNSASSSVETLIQPEWTSDKVVEKQPVNGSDSVDNSGEQDSTSDNNVNKDIDVDVETNISKSVTSTADNQTETSELESLKIDNIVEENDINNLTNSKDQEASETIIKDDNINKELECGTKDNDSDIAMETDEQQTAEEILNDLDDI